MKTNKILVAFLVVAVIIIMFGIIYICYSLSDLKEDNNDDSNYNYTNNYDSSISDIKKDTFITMAQQSASEVRLNFINGDYDVIGNPSNGECLAVSVNSTSIDSTSSFDSPISNDSYVIIYNKSGSYEYYIQMIDEAGNGFGLYREYDLEGDLVVNNKQDIQVISEGSKINLYSDDGNNSCLVMGIVN